jgi:hypothetical protein
MISKKSMAKELAAKKEVSRRLHRFVGKQTFCTATDHRNARLKTASLSSHNTASRRLGRLLLVVCRRRPDDEVCTNTIAGNNNNARRLVISITNHNTQSESGAEAIRR